MIHEPRGTHALADGRGAPRALLDDAGALLQLLRDAVQRIGATVLQEHVQRFEPSGATVVLVLAESHASVHTYPEHGVYMLDIFTCGSLDAFGAARELADALGGSFVIRAIQRGPMSDD